VASKPFFMVGCVRSGTTFLRNVLRAHPHLASPEETHFYRWAEPFGAPGYVSILQNNVVLKKHRELDGISEAEFTEILGNSLSCRELYEQYMALYISRAKPTALRWFDKTPQNVYGVEKMIRDFPESKIIHIIRNPVDVISSLKIGKVVKVQQVIGAAHYWTDAIAIMDTVAKAYPDKVIEVKYEELSLNFHTELARILDELSEPYEAENFAAHAPSFKSYKKERVLSDDDMVTVKALCGATADRFGYSLGLEPEAPTEEQAASEQEVAPGAATARAASC
jgi:hypothetical protein